MRMIRGNRITPRGGSSLALAVLGLQPMGSIRRPIGRLNHAARWEDDGATRVSDPSEVRSVAYHSYRLLRGHRLGQSLPRPRTLDLLRSGPRRRNDHLGAPLGFDTSRLHSHRAWL